MTKIYVTIFCSIFNAMKTMGQLFNAPFMRTYVDIMNQTVGFLMSLFNFLGLGGILSPIQRFIDSTIALTNAVKNLGSALDTVCTCPSSPPPK